MSFVAPKKEKGLYIIAGWDRARAAAAVDCMWLCSRISGGLTEDFYRVEDYHTYLPDHWLLILPLPAEQVHALSQVEKTRENLHEKRQ